MEESVTIAGYITSGTDQGHHTQAGGLCKTQIRALNARCGQGCNPAHQLITGG